MATISELRKLRKDNSSSFKGAVSKALEKKGGGDPRFWKPKFSKDGTCKATIRILGAHPDEDIAILPIYRHFVVGKNGTYSQVSRLTLDEKDPCQEYGWKVFNQDKEEGKKYLAAQKFVMNIYIVKSENSPEDEGKVFLWDAPKTIAEKIQKAMEGDEEKEIEPKEVCGFFEAHNLILDLYKKGKFPRYDKCDFSAKATDLLKNGTDADYEAIWKTQYALKPFLAEVKPYAELKKLLDEALGVNTDKDSAVSSKSRDDDDDEGGSSDDDEGEDTKSSGSGDDEEDDDAYYQKLAARRKK